MTESWKQAAVQHANTEAPRESCGLLVLLDGVEHYWPCKNLSDEDDVFILDPLGYAAAEDAGTVLAVVHSHPGAPAIASEHDKKACTQYGLPWFIYGMSDTSWLKVDP